MKLHLLLNYDGYLLIYAVLTEGKVHEIQLRRKLKLERLAMLVFDRSTRKLRSYGACAKC